MTKISQPISIQNLRFFQEKSIRGSPQYELKIFATVATHWVPDLPNIKGFLALRIDICQWCLVCRVHGIV